MPNNVGTSWNHKNIVRRQNFSSTILSPSLRVEPVPLLDHSHTRSSHQNVELEWFFNPIHGYGHLKRHPNSPSGWEWLKVADSWKFPCLRVEPAGRPDHAHTWRSHQNVDRERFSDPPKKNFVKVAIITTKICENASKSTKKKARIGLNFPPWSTSNECPLDSVHLL